MEASLAGGNSSRWWAACPGWPPGWRRSWPGGGGGLGGLTRSEEGGLEEVEESLRAAASWACTWARVASSPATVAVSASTCACRRWQLAQGVAASTPMLPILRLPGSTALPVNRHSPGVLRAGVQGDREVLGG